HWCRCSFANARDQQRERDRISQIQEVKCMPKYGKAASKSVESAVRREKKGTLKSGKGGKGGTVTSRKQAIAIGLSEARKKGAKVPRKYSSSCSRSSTSSGKKFG